MPSDAYPIRSYLIACRNEFTTLVYLLQNRLSFWLQSSLFNTYKTQTCKDVDLQQSLLKKKKLENDDGKKSLLPQSMTSQFVHHRTDQKYCSWKQGVQIRINIFLDTVAFLCHKNALNVTFYTSCTVLRY